MSDRLLIQGDVPIRSVPSIPEGAVPVQSRVLREGEVTGHAHIVEGDAAVFSLGGDTRATALAVAFSSKDDGQGVAVGVSPTVQGAGSGNGIAVAVVYDGLPAPTLAAKNEYSSAAVRKEWYERSAAMFGAVRRLTPRECERLQGFPDDWTLLGDKTPDSPRYRALGNAVAVPVAEWIGRRIASIARAVREGGES